MVAGEILCVGLVGVIIGMIAGGIYVGKKCREEILHQREMSDKHLSLFTLMDSWVELKQNDINLSYFFLKNGYKKIAIYGMSYAGERLVKELENTEVQICYGIDKNADRIYSNVPIYTINNVEDDVDAVVVTAVYYYNEIGKQLDQYFTCPIISLEDVIYS